MNKIREEVEQRFLEVNKTRKADELKEEIINDLEEKYSDLIKEGKDEKVAYKLTISGLNNIDEIITLLNKEKNPLNVDQVNIENKKTAFIVTISVFIYILSVIAIIVLDELGVDDYVSIVSFLFLAGIATCILIYHYMSKTNYKKEDTTITEEFKEWKGQKQSKNTLAKSVNSLLMTITTIIYLIVSFATGAWYITWIIYLIGAAVRNLINIIMGEEYE